MIIRANEKVAAVAKAKRALKRAEKELAEWEKENGELTPGTYVNGRNETLLVVQEYEFRDYSRIARENGHVTAMQFCAANNKKVLPEMKIRRLFK